MITNLNRLMSFLIPTYCLIMLANWSINERSFITKYVDSL